jgi:hypothetical protein
MKLGPTGRFPYGKIKPEDEGELRIAAYVDEHRNVCLDFGDQVAWIGMPKEKAIAFAKALLELAESIQDG